MSRSTPLWLLPVVLVVQVLALSLTQNAQAQDDSFELAALQNGVPLLANASGAAQPIPAPPGDIVSMAWSPDGQKLALVVRDENYRYRLFVSGPGMSAAIPLDSGNRVQPLGATFAPDGTILYAAGCQPSQVPGCIVDLRRIAPEADAQPVTLGQFEYPVLSGGGAPNPSIYQLRRETTYPALQWTPLGIVHVYAGAFLLNPATGEDRLLGNFNPFVVSPDGTMAASVRYPVEVGQDIYSLVLIDLATGAVTDLPTLEQPDRVAWALDGSIIYSTRTPVRDITAGMSETDRTTVDEALVCSLGTVSFCRLLTTANTVRIQRLDLVTGVETTRFTGDAYAVGRMQEAADGSLVFSLIPNIDAWAQAIVSGQLDPMSDTFDEESRAFVPITVYSLAADETTAVQVGTNLEQFELRPVSAE